MSDATPADFTRDLVRWSETLAGIARTGMGFTESLYERERYEEILHVAADIKWAADEALEVRRERDHFVQEWMDNSIFDYHTQTLRRLVVRLFGW